MAIRHLEESKLLRNEGGRLGRSGMSERIISIISGFDGSYKDAMRVAGAIKAIAIAAKCDDYWDEQVQRGYYQEIEDLQRYKLLDGM